MVAQFRYLILFFVSDHLQSSSAVSGAKRGFSEQEQDSVPHKRPKQDHSEN